jgi:hypothetical protein
VVGMNQRTLLEIPAAFLKVALLERGVASASTLAPRRGTGFLSDQSRIH